MPRFLWKDDYCVGDAIIDSQHQYLFMLAGNLVDSRSKEDLLHGAMKLFRYVREHFRHEEAVMRQIFYPAYQEHVALHEKLIEQLSALSSDIHQDRWSVAGLYQFMDGWLCNHIARDDRKLGQFIRNANRRAGADMPAAEPLLTPQPPR